MPCAGKLSFKRTRCTSRRTGFQRFQPVRRTTGWKPVLRHSKMHRAATNTILRGLVRWDSYWDWRATGKEPRMTRSVADDNQVESHALDAPCTDPFIRVFRVIRGCSLRRNRSKNPKWQPRTGTRVAAYQAWSEGRPRMFRKNRHHPPRQGEQSPSNKPLKIGFQPTAWEQRAGGCNWEEAP